MGLRNCWREYPKAIEVNAATSEMTGYIYSPYGEPLDLRRYSDWVYGMTYESGRRDGAPDTYDYDKVGPRYIAKTSELFVDATAIESQTYDSATAALFFEDPPLLSAGAEWLARTRAFDDIAPVTRDDVAAKHMRDAIDFILNEQEYRHWYSFLDYGDIMHSFDPDRDCWRFDQGGYAWNNNEAHPCEGLWRAFLSTQDPRLFRMAEAMTRHNTDVDMFHMGPQIGHGMRHNVNHYGCCNRDRRSTFPSHKRFYYFLTGDEHTRETVSLIYESLCNASDKKLYRGAMEVGVSSAALLFLWETTHETRYGDLLKKTVESYCAHRLDGRGFASAMNMHFRTGQGSLRECEKDLAGFFLLCFGPTETLLNSVELLGSEAIHGAILEWIELLHIPVLQQIEIQRSFPVGRLRDIVCTRLAAYAYKYTRDNRYLRLIKDGLDNSLLRYEKRGGAGPLETREHFVPKNNYSPNDIEEFKGIESPSGARAWFLNDGTGNPYLKGESGHGIWVGHMFNNIPFGLAAVRLADEGHAD